MKYLLTEVICSRAKRGQWQFRLRVGRKSFEVTATGPRAAADALDRRVHKWIESQEWSLRNRASTLRKKLEDVWQFAREQEKR